MTILREMRKTAGDLHVTGDIGYVSQVSWIFSGTLRENITFGQSFDPKKFKRAVHKSALDQVSYYLLP